MFVHKIGKKLSMNRRIYRVKKIRIWYTTFLLWLYVAHKTTRKKSGAIIEFMLFPDKSELHKKCTGSTHATFSVELRQGRCKLYYMQRGCTLCEFEIMRDKMLKTSHFLHKIWNNPYPRIKNNLSEETARPNYALLGTVRYRQRVLIMCLLVWYGTVRYRTVQYIKVQYSKVQCINQ